MSLLRTFSEARPVSHVLLKTVQKKIKAWLALIEVTASS